MKNAGICGPKWFLEILDKPWAAPLHDPFYLHHILRASNGSDKHFCVILHLLSRWPNELRSWIPDFLEEVDSNTFTRKPNSYSEEPVFHYFHDFVRFLNRSCDNRRYDDSLLAHDHHPRKLAARKAAFADEQRTGIAVQLPAELRKSAWGIAVGRNLR